jgi:hypothetical protein
VGADDPLPQRSLGSKRGASRIKRLQMQHNEIHAICYPPMATNESHGCLAIDEELTCWSHVSYKSWLVTDNVTALHARTRLSFLCQCQCQFRFLATKSSLEIATANHRNGVCD